MYSIEDDGIWFGVALEHVKASMSTMMNYDCMLPAASFVPIYALFQLPSALLIR